MAKKSTQVAINEQLIENGIREADEIYPISGNKYELAYVGSSDDIDSDEIVSQLEEAGFNPHEGEWLSTSDFEDLPVTEDYLEGLDDGLDQAEEFRVVIEYNPRNKSSIRSIPQDVAAKLNAIEKRINTYKEAKNALEETFENTLNSICRGLEAVGNENSADAIRAGYNMDVQPFLDSQIFEEAYWHFHMTIEDNLD